MDKAYGFAYECEGKQYSCFVMADSEESAKRRIYLMNTASFVGELMAVAEMPESASFSPGATQY